VSVTTLLIIIVILALVGAFPVWPYSRGWGWGVTGIPAILLIILIVLLLTGRL
jgi:hypothetical protein